MVYLWTILYSSEFYGISMDYYRDFHSAGVVAFLFNIQSPSLIAAYRLKHPSTHRVPTDLYIGGF